MLKIIRLIVVLFVITGASGLALSYVRSITAEPIEYAKVKLVKAPAVAEVFEAFKVENDPVLDRKKIVVGQDKRGNDIVVYAFPGVVGGKIKVIAIETFGVGYHDGLGVMTAIGTEGENKDKVIKIAITSHHETPGKGDAVEAAPFRAKFVGLGGGNPVTMGDIDAISGATMSTQGVLDAVNTALEIFKANQAKLLS